jgi:hypothetical protein
MHDILLTKVMKNLVQSLRDPGNIPSPVGAKT